MERVRGKRAWLARSRRPAPGTRSRARDSEPRAQVGWNAGSEVGEVPQARSRKKGRGGALGPSATLTGSRLARRLLRSRRPPGLPGLPSPRRGLPESLALSFKAAATTSTPRWAPRGPAPRLPRPRSLQPLANRWAVSAEVPTPCLRRPIRAHPPWTPRLRPPIPPARRCPAPRGEPPLARSAVGRGSPGPRRPPTHARKQPGTARRKTTPPGPVRFRFR